MKTQIRLFLFFTTLFICGQVWAECCPTGGPYNSCDICTDPDGGADDGSTSGSSSGSSGGSSSGGTSGGSSSGGTSGGYGGTDCFGYGQAPGTGGACCSQLTIYQDVCTCKEVGTSPANGVGCCPGLVLNNQTNKCENQSSSNYPVPGSPLNDPTHISCNPGGQNQCPQGTACYERRVEDFFVDNEAGEMALEKIINDVGEDGERENNEFCFHDFMCQSLKCENLRCKSAYICRKADSGEPLKPGATCMEELVNMGGTCRAVGFIDFNEQVDFTPTKIGECKWEYNKDNLEVAKLGMKTVRAIEFLYKDPHVINRDDCFIEKVNFLKRYANQFLTDRKSLIAWFNQEWLKLEADEQVVLNANRESRTNVSLLDFTLPEWEVANRRTVGLDALYIMMRRLQVMKEFEEKMGLLTSNLVDKYRQLHDEMKYWDEDSKEWNIGGSTYHGADQRCRWGFFGWFNRKVKNRWDRYYRVKELTQNGNPFQRDADLSYYISLITGEDVDTVKSKWGNPGPKYYLVDPMLKYRDGNPSNIFEAFGDTMFLASPDKRRSLEDLSGLYMYISGKVNEHYRSLNPGNIQGFVVEPELVTTAAKNCFNQPTNKHCDEFHGMLKDVASMTFAQFMAYSKHKERKYKKFFGDHGSNRMKLFAYYKGILTNLQRYYDTNVTHREEQIACIEIQINGVEEDFYNVDNMRAGVHTGAKNYYEPGDPEAPGQSGNPSPRPNLRSRQVYQFHLSQGSLNALNTSGMFGGPGKNSQEALRAALEKSNAALAARTKEIKDSQAKLAVSGVNLAARKKLFQDALTATSKKSGASLLLTPGTGNNAASVGGNSPRGEGSSTNPMGSSDSHSKPEKNGSKDKNSGGLGDGVKSSSGNSGVAGIAGGFGGQFGQGGGSTPYTDPTGLSSEEKDVILANIDRNKSKLKRQDEDDLWTIISKQYANSLSRILNRKKSVEE